MSDPIALRKLTLCALAEDDEIKRTAFLREILEMTDALDALGAKLARYEGALKTIVASPMDGSRHRLRDIALAALLEAEREARLEARAAARVPLQRRNDMSDEADTLRAIARALWMCDQGEAGYGCLQAADALDALEAERDRLRALTDLPGDLHWHADDPEGPLECWSTPIEERWESAGTVFEIMCARKLPHIWVAERVLTVDEHGDPDETEAAWFATRAEAEACYPTSLAAAIAALKGDTP